ncbi:MAG: nuclear transport factor 2 family protein [Pseudomonadota bacterium]
MTTEKNIETVQTAWAFLGAGELDKLAALYSEDMNFVIPGQNDVLSGRSAFRAALNSIGEALPGGFDITDMSYFGGDGDVMNLVKWKSNKVPEGTQSAILWKFDTSGRITEERWFVDTEQWRVALG